MSRKLVIYTRYSSDLQSPKSCADQERDVRGACIAKALARGCPRHQRRGGVRHQNVQGRIPAPGSHDACGRNLHSRGGRPAALTRAGNAHAFITDLVYAGGRFISTGEGLDTTQQGWQLRVKVMELHNTQTIEELGRRVRRGQTGRLLANLTAGDYPMGYESFLVRPEQALTRGRGPKPEKDVRIKDLKPAGSGRSSPGLSRAGRSPASPVSCAD